MSVSPVPANSATVAELESLPGMTAAAAAAIIADRPFASAAAMLAKVFVPAGAVARMTFDAPGPTPAPAPAVVPLPVTPPAPTLPIVAAPLIMVGASPLNITNSTPTNYVGKTASAITVNTTLDVLIDHCKFDNLTVTQVCNLTATSNEISGANAASGYAAVVWRFQNLIFDNNLLSGPGALFQDASGKAQTARARFNHGINIAGPLVAGVRQKRSFIQFANLHLPGLELSWNWSQATRGVSAMEDCLSFMKSGGTASARGIIANNLVDGNWQYPAVTAAQWAAGDHFSGSGIMAFDPGASENETIGGYTDVHDNVVVDIENQGIACAGSHDIAIYSNLLVKDGTGSPFGTLPSQVWNWGEKTPATPADLFAVGCKFYGNQYNWLIEGKPVAPSLFHTVDQSASPNMQVAITEAQARSIWAARVLAAGVTIGPK